MRQPWMTDWPTPPQPMIATVEPGSTPAVLSAAPTPVVTPQPMSASCSSGRLVSIFTIDDSLHVIVSAKVPRPVIVMYSVPSGRLPRIAIITFELGVAEVRLVVEAEPAGTARGDEGGDDVVALLHVRDLLADLDAPCRRPRGRGRCRA